MGKYTRTAVPGLHVVLPVVERIRYAVSLKETVLSIMPQHAITKDNVQVKLDGMVYYRVVDPFKVTYNIDNPELALQNLAQSVMRKQIGQLDLDQTLHSRSAMNAAIEESLRFACENWGIAVFRYEIQVGGSAFASRCVRSHADRRISWSIRKPPPR